MTSTKITKPTFIIDKEKMLNNIAIMAQKAEDNKIELRPHVKTHQSLAISEIYHQFGINKIAVSSVDMARYFIEGGWKDVSICVPLNLLQIPSINQILQQYPEIDLHLLIENEESLSNLLTMIMYPVHIWMEIDVGYHRTGILSTDFKIISSLVKKMSLDKRCIFEGILTHAGHSYHEATDEGIQSIYNHQIAEMKTIQAQIKEKYGIMSKISVGDTPTCSIIKDFDPCITEIRPGNYIFYDVAQHFIGSCKVEEIAGAVACPIIATYPEREEIVVYGGSVHFSYYHGNHPDSQLNHEKVFGLVCVMTDENRWQFLGYNHFLKGLSQEHGQIHAPRHFIDQISIGDVLYILPYHSCTSANLFPSLYTVDGEKFETYQYK